MELNLYEYQLDQFLSDTKFLRPEFLNFYRQPCLDDDTLTTGFDTHYIYHVAWAIRKIVNRRPLSHTDISSSLGFVTSISSFIPTTFFDFRPANIFLNNLTCKQGNLTLSNQWDEKFASSLSCMHVVEHIGLGRYGDTLNATADITAIENLKRFLAPGGHLFFVVPVGVPSIYFNAHRVYSAQWIIDFFSDICSLEEFYFIPGPQNIAPILNCDPKLTENFPYGCGCFEFKRI